MSIHNSSEKLQAFLSHFSNYKRSGKYYTVNCPAHQDENPSLDITEGDKGLLICCRSNGCEAKEILAALGLTFKDIWYENPNKSYYQHANHNSSTKQQEKPKGKSFASLDEYAQNKDIPTSVFLTCGWEEVIYQNRLAIKIETKAGSRYRFLDGLKPKFKSVIGYKPCWYRLDEAIGIARRNGESLIICNGEPSTVVAQHYNLGATSICGGEMASIPQNLLDELKSKWNGKIIIAFDNDTAGKNGTINKYKQLQTLGLEIQTVKFMTETQGYDLADFTKHNQHNTYERLVKLPEVMHVDISTSDSNNLSKPWTNTNEQMSKIIPQAWALINRSNTPYYIFQQDNQLVRIVDKPDTKYFEIQRIDKNILRGILCRLSDWFYVTTKASSPDHPPDVILSDMLVNIDPAIPHLSSIATSPFFLKDGTLITEPGYYPIPKIYYPRSKYLHIEPIPAIPSTEDIKDAVQLLYFDVLADFPFATISDKTNALATILEQFMRPFFLGCRPLRAIDSPTKGTGKGLLASVIQLISFGEMTAITTLPTNRDEWAKLITSLLLPLPDCIFFDNVKTTINAQELDAVLTAGQWRGRELGKSKVLTLPNTALWVITGNNLSYGGDLSRRVIPIRMVSPLEEPWNKSENEFKHPYLIEWVKENRSSIVRACLLLIQAWVAEGKQLGNERLGSFELWAKTLSGLLNNFGFQGFLENLKDLHANADSERLPWLDFVSEWFATYGSEKVKITDLNNLCEQKGLMYQARGDEGARSQELKLAWALKRKRDAIYGGKQIIYTIESDSENRAGRRPFYYLSPV